MNLQIIDKPLRLTIHGFSGNAANHDSAQTAMQLSNRLWQTIKANNIKNKGLNIWVYGPGEQVFAGVELENTPSPELALEAKTINLAKYARFHHVGPYRQIKEAGQNMRAELMSRGFRPTAPYIEIYGHWSADETKSETELLLSLE